MRSVRSSGQDTKRDPARLRMKDLIRETDLSRETIHFYIANGLVPPGEKTSRTTSDYTQGHVERLRWIRRLREEQFLPLRAVKVLLGDEADRQRRFVRGAHAALADSIQQADDVPLASVEQAALMRGDLAILEENDLIEIKRVKRRRTVSSEDAEIIELFSGLREAGFTRERGYTGAELLVFDSAMGELIESEMQIGLARRLVDESPEVLRSVAERANPLLEQLMVVMRRKKLKKRNRDLAAADHEPTERKDRSGTRRRKK